jgi:CheY-like chemotaxis protein
MMAVISVGAHPELVRLRDFVLQEAGFHVVSTLDEHEALARIERGECSVLLVCSSLAKATRRRLADALRKSCPAIARVCIAMLTHLGFFRSASGTFERHLRGSSSVPAMSR